MDIPDEQQSPAKAGNVPEFSVGQISMALQRTIEGAFARVRVRGEISGFKRAPSGHLYFALKDADAVLDACCWKNSAARLDLKPEDGMEVIVTGRLTTFGQKSKYQIVVDRIELAGQGALLALIEERKRRLAAEGLFDPARKRPLPFLPDVIGVVTSPTGAVIRDILHRLADRFPRRVLVWPVLVQGQGAAAQVAAAIAGFNALAPDGPVPRPDLLIVARGGGSLEDLMAFNEEAVVRAAAASTIPLISAVGHETDTTLIDFAADRRAPTPTAAAELAVPVRTELLARLYDHARRLVSGLDRGLQQRRSHLGGLGRGLPDPTALLANASQRLDDRAERLDQAQRSLLAARAARVATLGARLPHPRQQINHHRRELTLRAQALASSFAGVIRQETARIDHDRGRIDSLHQRLVALAPRLVEERRRHLGQTGRLLDNVSYRGILDRGFALLLDGDGHPVTSPGQVTPGQALTAELAEGRRLGLVVAGGAAKPKPKPAAAVQGSLL